MDIVKLDHHFRHDRKVRPPFSPRLLCVSVLPGSDVRAQLSPRAPADVCSFRELPRRNELDDTLVAEYVASGYRGRDGEGVC